MMFNEVPFSERFAAAAKSGFKGVEFLFPYDYPVADVMRWLQESHLQSVLFNMPPGDFANGERGIASLPGREAEFRASVDKALEYALPMGTPTIHVMAGLLPGDADRRMHRATYLENLRYAAKRLEKHGLILVIEPINVRDTPDYFLNTQSEAHAICNEIGMSNLKVQMDFYHCQIVEGDLTMNFRNNFSGIGHIQIASVPSRNEPDQGEVNYGYIFRLLDETGYAGWVGCEYRPRGNTEEGLIWLKEMITDPA